MSAFIHSSAAAILSQAQTKGHSGWISPGTVADVVEGSSYRNWSTPGNAAASDGSYATSYPLNTSNSNNYLEATAFDFSAIPEDATIIGVEARIERIGQEFISNPRVFDDVIQLIVGGARQGDNQSSAAGWAYSAEETVIFGADNNLWGLSLTVAQVKASNFGLALRCTGNPSGGKADVDHMQLKIHFHY